MRTAATLLVLALSGCIGVPNPVAPRLRGSVGVTHFGVLTDGVALPQQGEGFKRLRDDDVRWGTPRLVALIEHGARAVHRARGGAPLVVADVSQKGGGEIPGHRSHRTGRDVDLLLYALTPSGAPIAAPGFVRYGPDGLGKMDKKRGAHKFLRLDVERTWLLVKALIEAPDGGVQWLFVSRPIEALLTEYAMAKGEDELLIWKAENMMLQPADSSAHDDHIHLRIACAPSEGVEGCLGGGPYWSWLPQPKRLGPLADADLAGPAELLPR